MATPERAAETLDRLQELVIPVIDDEGFELIDLTLKTGPKRLALQIMIDRKGRTHYRSSAPKKSEVREGDDGVSIADCVRVSKLLSPVLDVEDLITAAYTLEVSSPGVNRPLRTPAHFKLATGAKVRVKTRVPVAGEQFFVAPLVEADDEHIVLDVSGEQVQVPYRAIRNANIEYEF